MSPELAPSDHRPLPPDRARPAKVHRALLDWYAAHGRDLPWRHTRDPYAILVAEVMLQQTQVERVLPKYAQFLERFPTLQTLAQATRAEVIRMWAPLGYNVRAVRLHTIAVQATEEHGGKLPDSVDQLLGLKGLGPYTAAAVACFAFELPVAVVDTNVRRVLARVFLAEPDGRQVPPAQLHALAQEVLPSPEAYGWNQALMDLGATICLARQPACERCPLEQLCRARRIFEGRPGVLAARERRAPYRAQPAFTDSSRYFRGRIVDALRACPDDQGLPLPELGARIKPDFSESDLDWLRGLVENLVRDGLVSLIPTTEGVASSAAVDGGEATSDTTARVALA